MKNNDNPFGFGKIIDPEDSLIARTSHASTTPLVQNQSGKEDKKEINAAKKASVSNSMFVPRSPRYRYEDLVLPESVFHELEVLQSMLQNHDKVYGEWGMGHIDPYGKQVAFNLYGPSGTGKTMIVEALCQRWDKPLIDINLSQLESKYVGDTGKNIAAAFATAKEHDAVLFFDEADTVLGRRLSEVTQSADSSVNTARGVMLKQLEQHSGIVAFATNFAHNYDTAFVRRILKHIHIPLPDESSRLKLWQKKIPLQVPGREQLDFALLAKQSNGLAGGDILIAVKNALFDAVRQPEAVLTTTMLLGAVGEVQSAKENVGSWGGKTETKIRELTSDEARKEGIL